MYQNFNFNSFGCYCLYDRKDLHLWIVIELIITTEYHYSSAIYYLHYTVTVTITS